MKSSEISIYPLSSAILALQDGQETAIFLRDLLTQEEITELELRWECAQLLSVNTPYTTITSKLGLSSTTIARINKWLTSGMGGYRLIIDRLASHTHHHTQDIPEDDS